MKVAVLGGTGFLGSKICAAATKRGWLATPIGSRTSFDLSHADAVVHSVGTIMPDPQYKRLISQPLSLRSVAKLAKLQLGLEAPNPLNNSTSSFEHLNYETARDAALELESRSGDAERVPFIYISAEAWTRFADPRYIATKRKAETLLGSLPYLRSVFLRPGFISPDPPADCSSATPRHMLDTALSITNDEVRVSARAVAEAVCDAIEDPHIEGIISNETLKTFEAL